MTVVVSAQGAARWQGGHPWIYRTDVYDEPGDSPGIVTVTNRRGRHLGQALYSPKSEIRLRLLTHGGEPIDAGWWGGRIAAAAARRAGLDATGYRVVHAEGDGLPALIVDRYGAYVVAQLLSAGLERVRDDVIAGIRAALGPEGVLLRNDAPIRRHEGLPLEIVPAFGTVPELVEVEEHGIRYFAAPHTGVLAVDVSAEALARGAQNAALNGRANITWREANAFDLLRELDRGEETFDTIVLDPPAFAKTKQSVPRARAGYKEINLRAMRILAPGGVLFTCSCSYHVHRGVFGEMLAEAARDSGRRLQLLALVGAGRDHPEIVTVPETTYLKGALLQAVD